MIQLRPSETFPITHYIPDPNDADADSYYIQAVIKDITETTPSTLDTVNLSLVANGVYKYNWQVVGDSGGLGRYVSITTTVYTNSGYTTLSPNYERITNLYLIQERPNASRLAGGGGGGINYDKIKEILIEILASKKEKDLEKILGLLIDGKLETLKSELQSQFNGLNSSNKAELEKFKATLKETQQLVGDINRANLDNLGITSKQITDNLGMMSRYIQGQQKREKDMGKVLKDFTPSKNIGMLSGEKAKVMMRYLRARYS